LSEWQLPGLGSLISLSAPVGMLDHDIHQGYVAFVHSVRNAIWGGIRRPLRRPARRDGCLPPVQL